MPQQAMGNVNSIQYSGTGMNAFFGQALTAGAGVAAPRHVELHPHDQLRAALGARRDELRAAHLRRPAAERAGQRRQGLERRTQRTGAAAPGDSRGAATEHLAHAARLSEGGSRSRQCHAGRNRRRQRDLLHGSREVQGRRHDRRAEPCDEGRDADSQPGHGRHRRRRHVLRLQGLQRRAVPDEDPRRAGGFPALGSDDHERHAERAARSVGAGRRWRARPLRPCRR